MVIFYCFNACFIGLAIIYFKEFSTPKNSNYCGQYRKLSDRSQRIAAVVGLLL